MGGPKIKKGVGEKSITTENLGQDKKKETKGTYADAVRRIVTSKIQGKKGCNER